MDCTFLGVHLDSTFLGVHLASRFLGVHLDSTSLGVLLDSKAVQEQQRSTGHGNLQEKQLAAVLLVHTSKAV